MEASSEGGGSRRRMGRLERACEFLCVIALIIMMLMIGAEVIARTAFGVSFEVSDEIGAYLLVAITFLSLSVCIARNSLHHVELVQARLSPQARAISTLSFDGLALVCSLIVLWQLVRLEWITWNSGDTAATWLMTPLWLPRLPMVLGMLALVITLGKSIIADIRNVQSVRDRRSP